MGVETIGSARWRTRRASAGTTAPAAGPCALEAMAQVLSSLLPHAVTAPAVRDRAVALGLLRLPDSEEGTELTVQTASRLLLTGYQLPAQVEAAVWPELQTHVRAGRQVFLLLKGIAERAVVQVQGCSGEEAATPWLLVTGPGAAVTTAQRLPLDGLAEPWAASGGLLLVAAPAWGTLPTEGPVFFAGSRSRDGVYHWNSAECDTDGEGRILRY